MFHSIVVPLDFGPDGDRAVPMAGALAARAGLPVELLTVTPPGDDPETERWLLRCREQLLGSAHWEATVVIRADMQEGLIRELQGRPDALVVMGTQARGPLSRLFLGSVTEAVLGRVDLPLLLVGPRAGAVLGRNLVVAVADANAGAAVLPSALEWTRRCGFDLWFVQVAPKSPHWWATEDNGVELGAAAELAATARALGVNAMWDVVPGNDPAEAIADFTTSMGGGVVAVVSRRWAEPGRTHWASTARALVHRAPHPVLVQPVRNRVLV